MAGLRRVLAVTVTVALSLAALPFAGALGQEGEGAGAALPTAPVVDPALVEELAGTQAAQAVVTTWTREDLALIEGLGVTGSRLRVLPMLLVPALTQAHLALLQASPAVRSVWANETFDLLMEDTTWITGARATWGAYDENGLDPTGYTGAGVEVAIIDTGADGRHADFGNLVEFCEARQAVSGDRMTVLCSPFDPATGNAGPAGLTGDARLDSVDDNGHGTHVAGTIGGTGAASGGRDALHSTIGMAPDVTLRSYSSNVGGSLVAFQILGSYDDMTYKKLHGFNDVVAVSNSWGGGDGLDYDADDPINVAVNHAYDAGILSVFAAGNSGPEHDTLSRQCVNPFVVCVGATTKTDAVVMFSSRGRPGSPADTDRDGIAGGSGDVGPGNHDRALGQAHGLGLYRPSLVAPGVNINAMMANSPTCYEGLPQPSSCYEPLNGTSMATPHVTGAVAVVSQAFRDGHGRNPNPAELTDLLERSAVTLPGYAAEEQGAGRLDVAAAVDLVASGAHANPLTLGSPVPPYAEGMHPGAAATTMQSAGCTGTASWTAVDTGAVFEPPPLATERFGQHTIDVPAAAERLRVTVDWAGHPGANLYLRLWRPGVDPGAELGGPGPDRVFPDNESVGLVFVGTERWIDVRTPVEGEWILRVYHRAGGAPAVCDPTSGEDPKQFEGFNYDLTTEIPLLAETPDVAVTSASVSAGGRFVEFEGTASYPTPWDGVVNWEVPGTATAADPGDPGGDDRATLHFRGNVADGCSGVGPVDVATTDCPYLSTDTGPSAGTAATWTATSLLDGTADRNTYDPNWTWWLDEPVTVAGPMTVEWWASCAGCTPLFNDDWYLRVWADGALAFEQRVSAGVALPVAPERMEATVTLPAIAASERLVLHVDPVYIDSQAQITVYYDGDDPCGGCDSLVRMPVDDSDVEVPDAPANLRVVQAHDGGDRLRVAWDPVEGASAYEVHRSTDPLFAPAAATLVAETAGTACQAPDSPSWPGASRDGLCWTDTGVGLDEVAYYRVVTVAGQARSEPSLLAYGRPGRPDRQVKVRVDRLFGPGYWEYATLLDEAGTYWRHTWDRLGLDAGLALDFAARSFTQGAGSVAATDLVGDAAGAFARGAGQVPGEAGVMAGTAATFSIRAREGEGGRLDYRDHAAGVRIRALSVDAVVLVGTGGNRAEITGTAEVQRDGQVTIEEFTVVCEDIGSPGRGQDLFEITTSGYAGGGTLVAGSVRVEDL